MAIVSPSWRSANVTRESDIYHEKLSGRSNAVANKGSPKKDEPGSADEIRPSLYLYRFQRMGE